MTTQLSPLAVQRFVDNNGNALAGGQLYTYQAGTSTLQPTYTDSTGLTANTNPIVLNARGEANIWVTSGQAYKFALYDSLNNLIWTVDNIIDASAALAANLASTTNATLGSALVGWFKSLANFVGRTLSAKLADQYSVCDYGAVGDGATNNATFLANCPATDLLVPPGTYLVNSNITIAANLRFAAGAVLKPASGVNITLTGQLINPPTTQIFDQTAGGLIYLPVPTNCVYPQWWGAKGDNVHDDTAAFQAAITACSLNSATNTIRVPTGTYKITSTLTASASNTSFLGEYKWGVSSTLMGSTSGMGAVLLLNSPGGGNYEAVFHGLQIQCLPGLASPPHGLVMKDASEVFISDCVFGPNLFDGIQFNGTDIMYVSDVVCSSCVNGMHFTVNGTSAFTANSSVWLERINIWNSSGVAMLIDSHYTYLVMRNAWIERAPYATRIIPATTSTNILGEGLIYENVQFNNDALSPYSGAIFFEAIANANSTSYMSLRHTKFINCWSSTVLAPPTSQFYFLINGNTNGATTYAWTTIDGGVFFGSTTSLINTDAPYSLNAPFFLKGDIEPKNSSNTFIPMTTGNLSWADARYDLNSGIWYNTGTQAASSTSPDFVFRTGTTRSGGNYIYQLNNGSSGTIFGVLASGVTVGNQISALAGSTIANALLGTGGVQAGQLNGGGVTSSSAIYSGSGVPSNSYGNNGDYYLRSDTPGTANQRIYVKNGSCTAIL